MNAFGVILHEGSHGLLAKSRTLNDRICNWGIAFWTINSVEEYRPTHRLHHRYLGQERDPDRVFYLVPARRGALTGLLLQDLFGVTAFRRATSRISGHVPGVGSTGQLADQAAAPGGKTRHAIDRPRVSSSSFRESVRGILFYVVFWLVPIVCMYPMILRLKTITEHFDRGLRDGQHRALDRPDQLRRVAPESPGGSQNGIPLRTPCPSHHSVSWTEEVAPPTGPDRLVHSPRRSHLARLRPLPDSSGGRQLWWATDTRRGPDATPAECQCRYEQGRRDDDLEPETETPLPVLDIDRLEQNVERLHADYQSAVPYPHIVIDDFLEPGAVKAAIAEFPAPRARTVEQLPPRQ